MTRVYQLNLKNLSAAFEHFLETQAKSSREEIVNSWCGQKKRSRTEEIPGPSNKIQNFDENAITEMKIESNEGCKKVHFDHIIQVQPIPRVGNQYPVCRTSHSQKYRSKWPGKFQ